MQLQVCLLLSAMCFSAAFCLLFTYTWSTFLHIWDPSGCLKMSLPQFLGWWLCRMMMSVHKGCGSHFVHGSGRPGNGGPIRTWSWWCQWWPHYLKPDLTGEGCACLAVRSVGSQMLSPSCVLLVSAPFLGVVFLVSEFNLPHMSDNVFLPF